MTDTLNTFHEAAGSTLVDVPLCPPESYPEHFPFGPAQCSSLVPSVSWGAPDPMLLHRIRSLAPWPSQLHSLHDGANSDQEASQDAEWRWFTIKGHEGNSESGVSVRLNHIGYRHLPFIDAHDGGRYEYIHGSNYGLLTPTEMETMISALQYTNEDNQVIASASEKERTFLWTAFPNYSACMTLVDIETREIEGLLVRLNADTNVYHVTTLGPTFDSEPRKVPHSMSRQELQSITLAMMEKVTYNSTTNDNQLTDLYAHLCARHRSGIVIDEGSPDSASSSLSHHTPNLRILSQGASVIYPISQPRRTENAPPSVNNSSGSGGPHTDTILRANSNTQTHFIPSTAPMMTTSDRPNERAEINVTTRQESRPSNRIIATDDQMSVTMQQAATAAATSGTVQVMHLPNATGGTQEITFFPIDIPISVDGDQSQEQIQSDIISQLQGALGGLSQDISATLQGQMTNILQQAFASGDHSMFSDPPLQSLSPAAVLGRRAELPSPSATVADLARRIVTDLENDGRIESTTSSLPIDCCLPLPPSSEDVRITDDIMSSDEEENLSSSRNSVHSNEPRRWQTENAEGNGSNVSLEVNDLQFAGLVDDVMADAYADKDLQDAIAAQTYEDVMADAYADKDLQVDEGVISVESDTSSLINDMRVVNLTDRDTMDHTSLFTTRIDENAPPTMSACHSSNDVISNPSSNDLDSSTGLHQSPIEEEEVETEHVVYSPPSEPAYSPEDENDENDDLFSTGSTDSESSDIYDKHNLSYSASDIEVDDDVSPTEISTEEASVEGSGALRLMRSFLSGIGKKNEPKD